MAAFHTQNDIDELRVVEFLIREHARIDLHSNLAVRLLTLSWIAEDSNHASGYALTVEGTRRLKKC
jgi:hypothetical protein